MDAIRNLATHSATMARRDAQRQRASQIYTGQTLLIAGLAIFIALGIIGTIIFKGAPALTGAFLTQYPDEGMSAGGIRPFIVGSILLLIGTFLVALPVGILAGLYLAEYAGTRSWVGWVKSLITSLAGTPSIIYGLLGLAMFLPLTGNKATLVAGCLTLAVMSLPVIVLSTENAIRNVPDSQIEAAFALGLTRAQVMIKVVLPQALPGILTGVVLSSGRAAGEAPPIILTAGVFYATIEPQGFQRLTEPVMNLAYYVTEGLRQPGAIPDQFVWGASLMLMAIILVLNLGAILIRARIRKSQRA